MNNKKIKNRLNVGNQQWYDCIPDSWTLLVQVKFIAGIDLFSNLIKKQT